MENKKKYVIEGDYIVMSGRNYDVYEIPVRIIVPRDVEDRGKEAVIRWLQNHLYNLAGSNDGSEFLAGISMDVNENTIRRVM